MIEMTISEALALLRAWYPERDVAVGIVAGVSNGETFQEMSAAIINDGVIETYNGQSLKEVIDLVAKYRKS
jgi:hypothetical protein